MKWNAQIKETTSVVEEGFVLWDAEIEAPDVIQAAMEAYGLAFDLGLESHEVISLEQKDDE